MSNKMSEKCAEKTSEKLEMEDPIFLHIFHDVWF
jgi:hypothetical protein